MFKLGARLDLLTSPKKTCLLSAKRERLDSVGLGWHLRKEWFASFGASETGASSVIVRTSTGWQHLPLPRPSRFDVLPASMVEMVWEFPQQGRLRSVHASEAAAEAETRRAHELEVARFGATAPALGVVSSARSGMTVAAENTIDQADRKTQFPGA